ncbi:MAG: hypothetical protein ACOH2B_05690 [Burkholderiaceae bacterium]
MSRSIPDMFQNPCDTLEKLVSGHPKIFYSKARRHIPELPTGWYVMVNWFLGSLENYCTDYELDRLEYLTVVEDEGSLKIEMDFVCELPLERQKDIVHKMDFFTLRCGAACVVCGRIAPEFGTVEKKPLCKKHGPRKTRPVVQALLAPASN